MKRVFTIILFMALSLFARENPFFPSTGEVDIPLSTNETINIDPLQRATVLLPSTARVIESITIKYKNLDGSLEEKTELLNNTVDWHLPLFISQNINEGEGPSQTSSTLTKKKKIKKEKFQRLAGLKFISLHERKNELKIVTKDKMLRNFLLTKPHRIVCDFKRDIDIRSYEKMMPEKSIVKRVRLGNHKGYYRVVIELDGYYRYKVKDLKNGYVFTFL